MSGPAVVLDTELDAVEGAFKDRISSGRELVQTCIVLFGIVIALRVALLQFAAQVDLAGVAQNSDLLGTWMPLLTMAGAIFGTYLAFTGYMALRALRELRLLKASFTAGSMAWTQLPGEA